MVFSLLLGRGIPDIAAMEQEAAPAALDLDPDERPDPEWPRWSAERRRGPFQRKGPRAAPGSVSSEAPA